MCGIVGYLGNKEKKEIILNGLKELEYRGYDSAGMAILCNDELKFYKKAGKLQNLSDFMNDLSFKELGVAIGHTRWATHGKPDDINSHPHYGEFSCVIHNGIIENYKELKEELKNVNFNSQTDTEVIVHLFEEYTKKFDVYTAFSEVVKKLQGAYAILLITKKAKNTIFFAKNNAPLIIAKGDNDKEFYLASCDAPLVGISKEVAYLNDGDYGYISEDKITLLNGKIEFKQLSSDRQSAQKDGFSTFMEKEIYEQAQIVKNVILGRIKNDKICFDELSSLENNFSKIIICACGTSYHAALASAYLFEREAKIEVRIEIASEFRYKDAYLDKNALFICISQSGETADTLEALKIAKENNLKTLALCNVDNSSIARLADYCVLIRAGIEKSVASTKAFCAQMVNLWLLSLYFNKNEKRALKDEIFVLKNLDLSVNKTQHEKIKRLSKRYLHGHGFFFISRDIFYPLALEASLKLKEISYLHAEGYAAGEMKHGPIALADSELFCVAFMPKNMLYEKTKSNVLELSARDANILVISPIEFDMADDFIKTKDCNHYMIEFFEMMVIMQLFALEIANKVGANVDMPRNLAKSVTVE
ncbi:glutamine--fructose-6-phosphate transaminase (isomerizing) [Campylobacter canadensis]|uniref:Glutamine--fructose-6-phosphate aminotransferase [isomerizing] n=1 Tax=Campylobacter canadensis TaxID=449520 RepID=A0ABS7WT60_9BACT|nr:glutamine--fructose-6-phosphate transaminase (isomerizing) [Campylobacter canadensis]MBZ7987561.1 glutamine--fructose-6-phosphate transaminase (isomerizing) [Campylobacter canadensis]MBZ7994906.1 glutamine--fructose-6-phosphate transaminase (isomerizing) [Campylobacter canadensis]MBZ7996707.1 glutamine--fructose-6-phosphate transaminase (isomerizing) [Campylobacter canadensis]MBZ7998683.1 glutamine--fructose-6-phosphate transaminase (isomerizing) [Campylobacter canadensis]MBZ8000323.1 gluta